MFSRREIMGAAAATLVLQGCGKHMEELEPGAELFGMIGQIKAVPGKRDELLRYLTEGSQGMAGNLAYMLNTDRADPDALWVVEIWQDEASHKASLALPQVRAAITKARPIIAGFGTSARITPVAGTH